MKILKQVCLGHFRHANSNLGMKLSRLRFPSCISDSVKQRLDDLHLITYVMENR